jgi:hypothetical protein
LTTDWLSSLINTMWSMIAKWGLQKMTYFESTYSW